MNSLLKKVSVVVAGCAVLSMVSVSAYAASVKYNVSSYKWLVSAANDSAYKRTIYANTRPTVGTSGAVINITTSDGTVKASKLFPYQVSISDLKAELPSGNIRQIRIKPYGRGQNIQGSVSYHVK